MRVVHLVPALNKGGTERLVINLAMSQRDLGLEVVIVTFSDQNHYLSETKNLNIQHFPNSSIQYRFLAPAILNLSRFDSFLKKYKPDVIHSHSYWTDLLVHGLGIQGPKYISHFHLYYKAYSLNPSLTKAFLNKLYDKYCLLFKYWQRDVKFILVSKDITGYYKKKMPKIFHSKLYYIPNATFIINGLNDAKKTVSDGVLKLFSAGRLVEVKNHSLLLDVAADLLVRGIEFEMKIAGEGPCRREIEEKIIKLGLEQKVILLGNVDDIDLWYSWGDLYIHAATSEPFGLTILEAMSHGKPCVCLRAGGNEDLITDGLEGTLLDNGVSAKEFAEKILMYKEDKELYEKASDRAINKSRQFNFNHYTSKILDIYKS